jgi:hypothetical protein
MDNIPDAADIKLFIQSERGSLHDTTNVRDCTILEKN